MDTPSEMFDADTAFDESLLYLCFGEAVEIRCFLLDLLISCLDFFNEILDWSLLSGACVSFGDSSDECTENDGDELDRAENSGDEFGSNWPAGM